MIFMITLATTNIPLEQVEYGMYTTSSAVDRSKGMAKVALARLPVTVDSALIDNCHVNN